MVVVHLAERSIPSLDYPDSSQAVSNFHDKHLFTVDYKVSVITRQDLTRKEWQNTCRKGFMKHFTLVSYDYIDVF